MNVALSWVRTFLAWWFSQLMELIPVPLRFWERAPARLVLIDAPQSTMPPMFSIAMLRGNSESEYDQLPFEPDSAEVVRKFVAKRRLPRVASIRVRAAAILDCPVVLPLATEPDLGSVLGYEIDRLTPFKVDEVYWTWTITERDRVNGRLTARLSFVPKSALRGLVGLAVQAGLTIDTVEGSTIDGEARAIRLTARTDATSRRYRRAVRAAGWACAALTIGIMAMPLLQQSLKMARVEAQIEALAPVVAEAEALRRAAAHPKAGSEVIDSARAESGDVVRVLTAITSALPDDTFLISFSLNRRVIRIEGGSAAAAKLIALLSAAPSVRNPHFAAPVTRSDSGGDTFSIQAEASP